MKKPVRTGFIHPGTVVDGKATCTDARSDNSIVLNTSDIS